MVVPPKPRTPRDRSAWTTALWSVLVALLGTAPAHAEAGGQWVRDHWTTRHGLPQNSVTDIDQDAEGFIWMSTYGGLVRFDGHMFETFSSANIPGLTAQRFLSLDIGADGSIWAGSEFDGLFRMRRGHATRYGQAQPIFDVFVDDDGTIWAAGQQHLLVIRGETVETRPIQLLSFTRAGVDGLLGGGITSPPRCLRGNCGGGHTPLSGRQVRRWFQLADGRTAATTVDGVFAWDLDTTGSGSGSGSGSGRWVMRAEVAPEGRFLGPACAVWQGHDWCAVSALPKRLSAWTPEPPSDGSAPATRMFVDNEDGLWIGLDGDGVVRYQAADVEHLGERQSVHYVVEVPAGQLHWGNLTQFHAEPPSDVTWGSGEVFWPLPPARALVVTGNGDVSRFDADGLHHLGNLSTRPEGPPKSALELTAPIEGPWFTVNNQLFRVRDDRLELLGPPLRFGAERVRVIRGDFAGCWLVLDEARIARFDGERLSRTVSVADLPRIRDLYVVDDDTLLLASYGAGMLRAEGSQIVGRITPDNGGCDSMVSRFFDTGDAYLWVNTNRGLGRLKRSLLDSAFAGDGMADCRLVGSNEGNGSQGLIDSEGRIVAPTVAGLARVAPSTIAAADHPRMILQTASYGDQDLVQGGVAVGDGPMRIRFVGLYFRAPHDVRYRYRLLGLNDAWSAPTQGRELHIQNLPPGKYVLQVQARGLGDWTPPVEVAFTRQPSFWEHPIYRWGLPIAIVLLVFGFLLGALAITRRRAAALGAEIRRRVRLQEELERQQTENTRILREREAAQRLEALGRLSGGIAHDFNNLFQVVAMRADLLAEHDDPEVREEAEGLIEVVDVGAEITRGLLRFGLRQPEADGTVDVGAAIDYFLPLLRRLIRADLKLELVAEPNCIARLQSGHLDQIVSNLVINARDATDGPGRIDIEVTRDEEHVILRVRDRGCGMTDAQAQRAFEPYFTTKALEQGTGLGLTTVHSIVRDAGGELTLDSELGQGTVAEVRLPLADGAPVATAAPRPGLSVSGLRILAVEDRADVRRGLATLLARAGAHATVVETADEAATHLSDARVDLLITDVVMPNTSGPEVRDRLRAIQSDLPTLFITGYVDRELPGLGDDTVLHKPFTLAELERAIAEVLGPGDEQREHLH